MTTPKPSPLYLDDLADLVREGIYSDDRMTRATLDAALKSLKTIVTELRAARLVCEAAAEEGARADRAEAGEMETLARCLAAEGQRDAARARLAAAEAVCEMAAEFVTPTGDALRLSRYPGEAERARPLLAALSAWRKAVQP